MPFTAGQRTAPDRVVNGGKGFIGTHSATDTLYEWPDYGRLVGAYFKEHPWTQQGRVIVEDASHPAAGARDAFTIEEEFYTFRENPRPRVQVLMRLDAASVGATGDYPLVWAQPFGSGRVYYNALGHFPATWRDARFQSQMIAAIRWTGTVDEHRVSRVLGVSRLWQDASVKSLSLGASVACCRRRFRRRRQTLYEGAR